MKVTHLYPYLTIEVTSASEVCTIALAGEADLSEAPNIEAALADACAGEQERIVVDLRNLTFIDSSGLRALMGGHEQCVSLGHELRIIRGPANIQRVFELSGMDDVLPFCDAELASGPSPSDDATGST
ncbi:MAG TPA: STAS domain-containing protein [Solirubrobacteraceae bacterium]|jgi:anti-anti-sigma factor